MVRSGVSAWALGLIWLLGWGGFAAQPVPEQPKLILMSPVEQHVFQRQTNESGVVHIVLQGAPDEKIAIIEARLTRVEKSHRGKDVDWTRLSLTSSKTGKDQVVTSKAELKAAAGGWYRLDIRAGGGEKVIAEVSVAKVGIGDVFITAGQSNSANFGQKRQSAQDGRVVYFDGKSYVPARDPIPGGFGGGGTPWPLLGDLLVAKWKVPIVFRSSTLTYTPVAEWLPDAKQNQYRRLVERTKHFGPRGVRAVLWHQGESDSLASTTAEQYRDRLTTVIRSMRKDIGYDVDWFVAQASFHPASKREKEKLVAEGQKLLWESKVCFPGPVTDDLLGKENRYDGVHFSEPALKVHAQRCFEALDKQYGASKTVETPK